MAAANQPNQLDGPVAIQGIQAVQQNNTEQQFPVRSLKILGCIQIGVGVLLGLLSIIGVVFDSVAMHKVCYEFYISSVYDPCWRRRNFVPQLLAFDVTCLVSSGWYVLTGFLPMCMSRKRADSWRGLRLGFMICSIIGASLFAPIMFSLGVVGAIFRNIYDARITVLSGFMAVLTFVELVIAIVASAYCCCCTPWNKQEQPAQMILMNTSQPGIFVQIPQGYQPIMGYQPAFQPPNTVGQPTTGMVQYPIGQQYVIPTAHHQQFPQTASNPPESGTAESQQSFSPPAYKE